MGEGQRWRDTTAEASFAVLAAVVEHAGMGIALVGMDGVPFQANPAFQRMTGYTEDELLLMSFSEFTHPDDVAKDACLFGEMVDGGRDLYRIDKRYICKDGSLTWASLTVSAVRRANGLMLFAVALVEDITERVLLQDLLQHQADHDHLTGLANRRLFDDRLDHALRLIARRGREAAVILLDLDGFKQVNDRRGHAVGDEVLKAVAARLVAACRDGDTVARVGGDEFAVLCEGSDTARDAEVLAARLQEALSEEVPLHDGTSVQVAASVGVVAVARGQTVDEVLRGADAAMYRQKGSRTDSR